MRRMVIALALAGMFSTGCAAESPAAPGAVTSVDALASALRAEGAAVVVEGSVSREAYPFFSITGVQLSVGGQRITAFAYPTAEAAAAAAASVSKDGSTVGTSNIFWVAPPRILQERCRNRAVCGHRQQRHHPARPRARCSLCEPLTLERPLLARTP